MCRLLIGRIGLFCKGTLTNGTKKMKLVPKYITDGILKAKE